MLCDHCGNDTDCVVSARYDLCLCVSCDSRFIRKLQYDKEALYELARQQEYWEACALPYVYSETE